MDTMLHRLSRLDLALPLFVLPLLYLLFTLQNNVDIWPRLALVVAIMLMTPAKQYQIYQRNKGEMPKVLSGIAAFYMNGLMLSTAMLLTLWKGPDGFLQENAQMLAVAFLMNGTIQLIFFTKKAGQPSGAASKNPNRLFLLWVPLWLALAVFGVVTKPELSLGQLAFFLIGLGHLVLPYSQTGDRPKLARRAAYGILLALLLAEADWP